MTTNPGQTSEESQQPSVFDTLATQNPAVVWGALLATAGAVVITVIVLAWTKGWGTLTLDIWLAGLALVAAGTGLGYFFSQEAESTKDLSRGDLLRLTALAATGLGGFVTFFYGVLLVVYDYPSIFAGKIDVMRENLRTIVLCVLPLFGGVILMYVGLALGRKFERTQAGLRRLVYGYNTLLGALLLFAILGVINLLAYTHVKPFSALGGTLDWTASGMYTLQEGSRKTVADLKEPVEVKVLLRNRDGITPDTITLLENCRQVNPEIRYQIVSPDEDESTYRELLTKYPTQITGFGLLVLYGKPGSQVAEFIKRDELLTSPPRFDPRDPEGGRDVLFQGEFALIKTLDYLDAGGKKTTVYFTQGNGELDIGDSFSDKQRDQGLGVLAENLGKGNYDVLHGPADKIPDNADVVVVAGPRKPLTPDALAALRKFLKPGGDKKRGKLIVMFNVAIADDKMVKTGLEDLVSEYNVTVGDSRLLCATNSNPRDVVVVPNTQGANPISKPFYSSDRYLALIWYNARPLQPAPPNPARSYTTEVLFQTEPTAFVWPEDNLRADPDEVANDLRQNQEKLLQRISRVPLPVALAVSESTGAGLPPGHPGVGPQKPVLVVFGDSAWVSNRDMRSRSNLTMFTGCLGWLRERRAIGDMPSPPKPPTYEFNVTKDQQQRMYWLPGVLIVLTIVSLSLGVWLVRRR